MAEAHALSHEPHEHPHPNYMAVFWALFGLTVVEVGIVYVAMSEALLISILLFLALIKAILVAMYFMHLRFDNIILSIIAGVPLVLVAIAVAVVAAESSSSVQVSPAGGVGAVQTTDGAP